MLNGHKTDKLKLVWGQYLENCGRRKGSKHERVIKLKKTNYLMFKYKLGDIDLKSCTFFILCIYEQTFLIYTKRRFYFIITILNFVF